MTPSIGVKVGTLVVLIVSAFGFVATPKPVAHASDVGHTRLVSSQTTAIAPQPLLAPPVAQPKAGLPFAEPPAPTSCADSQLSELVLVSISQRHLWACDGTTAVYDSPVITGMEMYAADLTPTGTYYISGKVTDTVLRGSDSTGSWDDPVSYWMPFLHNGYGTYGFHDATWRADSDFGNISPDSTDASHGCVELPLSTAAWLYNWASIGTTVTIIS